MTSLLKDRVLIEVRGRDRISFIQNLITNDINSPATYQYAMMLSSNGRFLFDMFVIKEEERLLLDIFAGTQDMLLDKLDIYMINQEVELSALHDKIYYSREEASYKDPRYKQLGYRFISSENLESDNSYAEDKYKFSIPDGGIDLLYDKSMPQEYGAEEINAISYTKGCYVGQEVISRTKYQGEVRKKIYSIYSDSDLSELKHGALIMQNDKKIGIFCSAYHRRGIALIREINLDGLSASVEDISVSLERACWY